MHVPPKRVAWCSTVFLFLCVSSAVAEENDGYVQGFPPGDGQTLVVTHCTGCHSAKLVTQQGQTEEGWDKLITWMQEEQGLWPIPENDRKMIVKYLGKYFGAEKQ